MYSQRRVGGWFRYPAITVTVNVASNAASPQVNQASVSGGGSATAGASDSTTILLIAPTATSLSPNAAIAGGAPYTLTVNGSGFASVATVMWNGTALTTTFGSATELAASAPASLSPQRAVSP